MSDDGERAARSRLSAGLRERAVVGLGLVAFVAATYAVVVLGGAALAAPSGRGGPPVALSVLATVLVALGLDPVRSALRRATGSPQDALARLTDALSGTVPTGEVPARMARVVAEATRAESVEVRVDLGGGEEVATRWPPDAAPLDPAQLESAEPEGRSAPTIRTLAQDGEPVGRLLLRTRDGTPLPARAERLLDDLSAHAGLALRSVRLATLLAREVAGAAARAEQLRASRERVVAVSDAARHALERDIHDGAQQHLVALAVQLGLARTLAGADAGRARAVVDDLRRTAADAVDVLARLSRGIYPQTLSADGPAAALRAGWAGGPMSVEVRDPTGRRHPAEVEAAAFFVCQEALQNAAKHAHATRAVVVLASTPARAQDGGALTFTVSDDGCGFDPSAVTGGGLASMRDRMESAGGSLDVRSVPGGGTTVAGYLPTRRGGDDG